MNRFMAILTCLSIVLTASIVSAREVTFDGVTYADGDMVVAICPVVSEEEQINTRIYRPTSEFGMVKFRDDNDVFKSHLYPETVTILWDGGSKPWHTLKECIRREAGDGTFTEASIATLIDAATTDSALSDISSLATNGSAVLSISDGNSISWSEPSISMGSVVIEGDTQINGNLIVKGKITESKTKDKKGGTMLSFLFGWMGSFLFWAAYVVIGLFVGTILCRHCDCLTWVKTGKGRDGCSVPDPGELFLPFLFYLVWPVGVVCVFAWYIVKFGSKFLIYVLRVSISATEKAIPKFKIVKDDGEE